MLHITEQYRCRSPRLPDRAGNVLEEDKDYTLTYSDDVVNSGIVTVTVNGITSASQNGKLVCTYQILPANISDNAVTRPVIMLMCGKVTHKNLIDNSPSLFLKLRENK